MLEFKRRLHDIVEDREPMTVRHAFYLVVSADPPLVPKTEAGYDRVQRALVQMRRAWLRSEDGPQVPFDWIADNTRWVRKPRTFSSAEAALCNTAETYRRALWADSPVYVEIWCESDSIADVIAGVTDGGAYLNFGSAVVLPEVFLKALSLARNLGREGTFVTADFDFIRHYRTRTNVVTRPHLAGGKGYMFTGHHEIMIPLFCAALNEALA